MPSMNEIYEANSHEYDELVNREDHQGNLRRWLLETFDFKGKTIIEAGAGTGRLTSWLLPSAQKILCLDRSLHMLDKARSNLSAWKSRLEFMQKDNLELSGLGRKVDFFVEGWSFGHTVVEHRQDLDKVVDTLVTSCRSLLKPGGRFIFIETLGTNADSPQAPGESLDRFYRRLEEVHGFTRTVIPTDYGFADVHEAARILGYFFGEHMARTVLERGSRVIREFTGVWHA